MTGLTVREKRGLTESPALLDRLARLGPGGLHLPAVVPDVRDLKASSNPGRSSARHLTWLRDELGDRFVHGPVLHTGQYIQQLGDRITAAPICTLWGWPIRRV